MAILLKEEGLLERTIIYATDINPRSLEQARQGIFAIDHLRQYTANYQQAGGTRSFSDYYTAAYDSAIMDKSLKEKVRLSTILGTFQSTLTRFKYLRKVWKDNTEEERLLGVISEYETKRGRNNARKIRTKKRVIRKCIEKYRCVSKIASPEARTKFYVENVRCSMTPAPGS